MEEKFPLSLLQAVSDWQRSSNVKRANKLKAECKDLPAEFRSCLLVCYRQIALPKEGVWNLIGEDCLPEKISSWTLDIEVAKAFKGGVPPEGQGFQGTILYLYPPPDSIIVNLSKLFRDADFLAAMEMNQSYITGYHDGAGRYRGGQNEVVLEIDAVMPEDIYSLGGYSSPLKELVAQAAELVYRRSATDEERQNLLLDATHAGVSAGPSWLNMDATRRVLARTKPQAEVLHDVKRRQDSGFS
ncbi:MULTISPECIES: hypothetical protein [Acetobacteraceae]|uniref:hypothetical protein n=1 Tax=Acetobacteraceae TaxID=433 RepID=UPI0007997391|nr:MULTISPECIES: hypothetical protein [Acetobacteraceae]KXV66954.1 hypothetical protein AD950_00635 [Gluconobacter oxydans]MCP1228955.1 hypothetical protein [Acetobacter fabarum]MCP1234450.1 hypothetical protein [Acetobacter fabarum]GFE98131.1 hypothetical protein DmGdi_32040 [Gluconobacter sp. Gdi]